MDIAVHVQLLGKLDFQGIRYRAYVVNNFKIYIKDSYIRNKVCNDGFMYFMSAKYRLQNIFVDLQVQTVPNVPLAFY